MTLKTKALLLVVAGSLAACETPAPLADGGSVRTLITEQTSDAAAASRNGTTLPKPTDADRAVAAVAAMREGVTKPKEAWSTTVTTGGGAVAGP
jgi:hypothetical protein